MTSLCLEKGRISVACEGLDENVDNGEPTIFLDHEYLFNERASIPNWVLPPMQAPIKDSLPKQSNYWMTMQVSVNKHHGDFNVPMTSQCTSWKNVHPATRRATGTASAAPPPRCGTPWGFSPAYRHSFVAHRGAITFPPMWNILTEVSSLSAPVRFPQTHSLRRSRSRTAMFEVVVLLRQPQEVLTKDCLNGEPTPRCCSGGGRPAGGPVDWLPRANIEGRPPPKIWRVLAMASSVLRHQGAYNLELDGRAATSPGFWWFVPALPKTLAHSLTAIVTWLTVGARIGGDCRPRTMWWPLTLVGIPVLNTPTRRYTTRR